ncbi:MAG: Ig-like domain-containing protein, partial [Anaerolineales bacterium]
SPAKNIGVDVGVATDIDGDARPAGGGFDAGFDEVVNHAPTAGGASYNTPEDTALHVAAPGLLATGTDSDGDPFTAQVASGPATGTLALSANGAFTYTPPLNFNGVVNFTYALSDGVDVSAPALVTVTVTPVNDAPTLTALASLTVTVGDAIGALPFSVGDVEDAAGALTMTATSSNHALLADDHVGVSGSGASRNLLLVPAASQTGSTLITLTVHDSQGGTASRAFTLTVVSAGGGNELYLPVILR